ncbi:MAG: AAA family ATPase [Phycisphaerae bacterium]
MTQENGNNILGPLVQEARILGESRMIRDEQPFTDELATAVIERLKAYLTRSKRSAESAARSMSIASSTLSQVMNGNYLANPEPHIRTIDRWLEQQLMREAAPKPAGFVKIALAEEIYGVVRWVMKTNSIGVIHGPNGCGKTMTLQAIRAETPGAVYCSIDSSGLRVRAVLEMLADTLRIMGVKRSTAQLFRQIVSALKDTGRLIIIDEVHKLAGRQKDDALHVLRDLHDATGCPMVWAGNGKIASYIRANKTDGNDPLDQIFGRITWWLDLTEKAMGGSDDGTRLYTMAAIQRVLTESKVRFTPDAARYLTDVANDPSLGCLRTVKTLVAMASVAAKDQPITAAILRSIQRERLGQRVAESVELQIEQQAAVA